VVVGSVIGLKVKAVEVAESNSGACTARVAVIVLVICGAAAITPVPAWSAVTTHEVVPLVIVKVLPTSEQPPVAAYETGSAADEVALMVALEPKAKDVTAFVPASHVRT
jgi:hypothetical protein